MRPRTPSILWIPFIFSIGTISWALLLGALAILAAVIITPAAEEVRETRNVRNNYQATLELLDQKITMQKGFIGDARTSTPLLERLAARQLNICRPDIEPLRDKDGNPLDPDLPYRNHTVETLLAESLVPVAPKKERSLPIVMQYLLDPAMRTALITIACAALAVSFFLGVKYERQ